MDTIKAVKEPEADPKAGKPRAKSGVSFPYWDLASAIEVAKVIHERAGGASDTNQLAQMLGYSGVSNGSFRTRVSAAKMFGLIEDGDDRKLRVSARGRRVVAPITPVDGKKARAEAFLAVDLFKRVYEQYKGTTLPENVGLKNLFANEYTMVKDRISPTVRILRDSAEQAGMFEAGGPGNRSRLAMPLGVDMTAVNDPVTGEKRDDENGGGSGGSGGGSGSGGGKGESGGSAGGWMAAAESIDPAIVGLLMRLPEGGTPMTQKRRKALIDAFTNVVNFIYPDADDEA